MTEKAVENRICRACGADVRPGALFCYACGSAVAPTIPVETKGSKNRAAREKATEPGRRNAETSIKSGEVKKTIVADVGAIRKPDEILPDEFQSKPNIDLKPAVPRRENRAAQKKAVKVVWEETEGEANVWFLVVALVLVAFAVLALVAMLSID